MHVVSRSKRKVARAKMTPDEYLTKYSSQVRAVNAAKSVMEALDSRYIHDHCTLKIGETIVLPENMKPGYTHFLIETIRVDVKELPKDQFNAHDDQVKYSIGFKAEGLFKAEGREDEKGAIDFNHKKKTTEDADQTKSES